MVLVDVHCHLQFIEDVDEIINRARKNGVVKIVNSGTNPEGNRLSLEFAKKYKIVEASLGLYPSFSKEKKNIIEKELEFIKKNKNKIISIGECGLDYQIPEDKKKQKDMFLKAIELCEKLKKPIIVHSRKAEKECLDLLESSKLKKVLLHCFSGKKSLIKRGYALGYYFSIPANIVKLQHFQTLVGMVDMSKLLTETDAPWLSPYPDKKNEPAFVKETIKEISEIKKLNKKEVENIIFMNYQKLFLR